MNMRIAKSHIENFSSWVRKRFKTNRESTSDVIWNKLQQYDKRLCRAIKRAGKKIGPRAYIGRHLLRRVTKEHWLTYENNQWIARPTNEQCHYCFSSISNIYVIDLDKNRYCNFDCLYDFDEATVPYDGYWDDYTALVDDFDYYHCMYKDFKHYLEPTPANHIQLNSFMDKFERWMEMPEYNTIYLNGGHDGPVAAEMYRMLMILEENFKHLKKIQAEITKARPKQNIFIYCHLICQKSKLLQNFIKKYKTNYCQDRNIWMTDDPITRIDWNNELTPVEDSINIFPELCWPNCHESYRTHRFSHANDGFKYCEFCYDDRCEELIY